MAEASESETLSILLDDGKSESEKAARLLPLVYEQLRSSAQQCLRMERAGHTLQATALVHEAFMKLVGPRQVPWRSRAHFYSAAAEAMRQILIDHARSKARLRRGGGEARRAALDLTGLPDPNSELESAGFLVLNDAIERLEAVDPKAAAVVRLRYFAGLEIEETAAALGVSPSTVKRDWVFARAWLRDALNDGA